MSQPPATSDPPVDSVTWCLTLISAGSSRRKEPWFPRPSLLEIDIVCRPQPLAGFHNSAPNTVQPSSVCSKYRLWQRLKRDFEPRKAVPTSTGSHGCRKSRSSPNVSLFSEAKCHSLIGNGVFIFGCLARRSQTNQISKMEVCIKVWLLRRRYRQYGKPPENFPSSRVCFDSSDDRSLTTGSQHYGYQRVILDCCRLLGIPVWIRKVGNVVAPCQPPIEEPTTRLFRFRPQPPIRSTPNPHSSSNDNDTARTL